MKKVIEQPYDWDPYGKDGDVDEALRQHFAILDVDVTGPISGCRQDVYHLEDYGVTLKHDYSPSGVNITLYGSDEKVGEVEKIVNSAIQKGLKEAQKQD